MNFDAQIKVFLESMLCGCCQFSPKTHDIFDRISSDSDSQQLFDQIILALKNGCYARCPYRKSDISCTEHENYFCISIRLKNDLTICLAVESINDSHGLVYSFVKCFKIAEETTYGIE